MTRVHLELVALHIEYLVPVFGLMVQAKVLRNWNKFSRGPLSWLRAGAFALQRQAEGNGCVEHGEELDDFRDTWQQPTSTYEDMAEKTVVQGRWKRGIRQQKGKLKPELF